MKVTMRLFVMGCLLPFVTPAVAEPLLSPEIALQQSSALVNYHEVNANLHRSGAVSAAAMKELADLGIKSILSLDDYAGNQAHAQAEADLAKQYGIAFTWYPMSGVAKPTVAQVEKALAFLQAASDTSVLVHCKYGSDRTGIVIAAYRMRHDGWNLEDAKKELRTYGHSPFLYWWDNILENFV